MTREEKNTKDRERAAKRKADRLCLDCGENPVEPGKSRCKACLERRRKNAAARRENRKESNLCPRCGREPEPEKKYCTKCLANYANGHKNKRKKRRADGVCTSCGGEKEDQYKAMCRACAEKKNAYERERRKEPKNETRIAYQNRKNARSRDDYRWRKKKGLCARCGKDKPAPKRQLCFSCLEKSSERCHVLLKNETEQERAKRLERQSMQGKKRYYTRKEEGRCTRCGKQALKGKTTCVECNIKENRNAREYYRKKVGYAPVGGCRICHKPVKEGFKFCEEHYQTYKGTALYARSQRKTEKNFFEMSARNWWNQFKKPGEE